VQLLPGSNANDDDDEAATRLRLPNDQDRQNRNTNEVRISYLSPNVGRSVDHGAPWIGTLP
jgi:hypothetical protein